MNKTICILMGLMLTSGVCFAKEHSAANKPTTQATAHKFHVAQGIIDALTPADAAAKVKAGISLKEDNGSVEKFIVSKATVFNADAKTIVFSQLKPGEKVKVAYSTNKDGGHVARSITEIR